MKESKRRRSLNGAVLIMILTVMFILIILLTATLTTVTTANQRIYTKFEENQAYYTARSALDVFTQNMLSDGNYISDIDYTYTKADGTTETIKMKQGLGLQMDLYMLKSQSGFCNVPQDKLSHFVSNTSDDELKKKVDHKDWFGTDSSKVKTDANGNEYIEYEVELPKLSDGSNKYGKLSDGLKATIKVEVLDRKYNIGEYDIGTYSSYADFFENAGDDEKAEAVVSGNRENDTMRIKITSTTTFDGVDGTAVVILNNTMPVTPPGTRAITVLGSTYELVDITVIGGISSPVTTKAQDAKCMGDTFIGIDLDVKDGNGSTFYFNNSECLYADGDLTYQNNATFIANETASNRNERPFVYVGGDLNITANLGGLKSTDVDLVVAGNLTVTANGTWDGWNGDIFVNGTIDLSGGGDHTQIVNGTVYSPTPITYNTGDSGSIPLTSVASGTFSIEDNTSTGGGKKLNLPDGSQRNLPYKEDIYSEYYEGGDINDPNKVFTAEDLAFVSKEDRANGVHTTDTFKALAESVPAENKLINNNGRWDNRQTTTVRGNKYDWAESMEGDYDWMYETTTIVTGEDYGPTRELTSGVYYIPTPVSNGWCNLDVVGGGTVELILAAGTYGGTITVDDNTTLKIYSYDENLEYTFSGLSIVNKGIKERIDNGENIYVGQYGDELISPTISIYLSKNCKLVDDKADDFFTAYIQSPQAEVHLRQAHMLDNVYYNNVSVGQKEVNILGSVLCGDLKSINHSGVAYVNPNAPSVNAGEPIHSWQSYQYVRS